MEATTQVIEAPDLQEQQTEVIEALPQQPAPIVIRDDDAILATIERKLDSFSQAIDVDDMIQRVAARVMSQVSDGTRRDWIYGYPNFERRLNDAIRRMVMGVATEEWRQRAEPKIEAAYLDELANFSGIVDNAVADLVRSTRARAAVDQAVAEVLNGIEAREEELGAMVAAPEVLQTLLSQRIQSAFAEAVARSSPELEQLSERIRRIEAIEEERSAYSERINLKIEPVPNRPDHRFLLTIPEADSAFVGRDVWLVELHLQGNYPGWNTGPICHGIKASWNTMRYLTQAAAPGGAYSDLDLTYYGNRFSPGTHYQVIKRLHNAMLCLPEAPILRTEICLADMGQEISRGTRLGRHLLSHGFRSSSYGKPVRLQGHLVRDLRLGIVGGPLA